MSDEIESEAERLVHEALEAGILRQNGPHFYATQKEEEDEHIGQGHDAALSYLEEEGYVEDAPGRKDPGQEDASADGEEPSTKPESDEEDASPSGESGEDGPPEGVYRHEGDEMVSFERDGRADGMLFPGSTYQNLPLGNDDIQRLIGEGILVNIS